MIQAYYWLLILPLNGQCHFMQEIPLPFPSDTGSAAVRLQEKLPPSLSEDTSMHVWYEEPQAQYLLSLALTHLWHPLKSSLQ